MGIQARKTFLTDSCGKMRFTHASAARTAAKTKADIHGRQFRVYRCKRCLGYHLTTIK